MKTLTIKQPWASLIAEGVKDIENRTWPTKFKGRVLIHSSAASAGATSELLNDEQFNEYWEHGGMKTTRSAIIGSVEIVDCVINHPSVWAEKSEPEKPTYNWVLANPILFPKPITGVKGKLSFWDYPNINSEIGDDEKPVCMCCLPVDEIDQVRVLGSGVFECKYCTGKWYK